MSTADALRRKLRERDGKAARQDLLQRFGALGGNAQAVSWVSLDESDSLVRRWGSVLGVPAGEQLTFRPPASGQRTWTCAWTVRAEERPSAPPAYPAQSVPLPTSNASLFLLFGDYRSMGIARSSPHLLTDFLEELALADGDGFMAVTESLDYVLQVDVEENEGTTELELAVWGDG
ncbi:MULTISPECIES: hypothetical protein [unclassified Streptomyces]|uniref:hypothetical protein n=1 Tax=unclassified Streptomyces TaxID=2593676 RepID=UPI0033E0300C